jgi:hypothetical protein
LKHAAAKKTPMSSNWRPSGDVNVTRMIGFCSGCAAEIGTTDRTCPCCGADTIDANLVTVLKRTSTRRSRGRGGDEGPDDMLFPL